MDEESLGLLGVLLIVTALVMSQTALGKTLPAPVLPAVSWSDVVHVFSCGHAPGEGCTLAMSE